MNGRNIALLLTFLLGIFILIGVILAFFLNKKSKVMDFILAMAFGIIVMLILTDLLPETIEHLTMKYIFLFLIFSMVGFLLFKILDSFVPKHQHNKMTKTEMEDNIAHIGTLTTFALVLHNIIEGMAIFIAASSDISLGIMMSLGVGLHNIPLGMVISSTFYQSHTKHRSYILYLILFIISSFIGGLIPYCFNISDVNDIVMGSLLALTLGMLCYIVVMELYPRIIKTSNKKVTVAGFITGILLLVITLFIHVH